MKCIIANSKKELLDHFLIRGLVFIKEQEINWDLEFDGTDYEAILFTAYLDSRPVGAARLLGNKVGRVAVLREFRKRNIGKLLMDTIYKYAENKKISKLELGSQLSAKEFYLKLGYVEYGDIFLDADIEHIMMKKEII